ncbi:hypothetical protein PV08_04950 [Exophiala spinifera]|uniref:Eisosome protein 1 n=1 Tax=Exophiala spinifera TaxID=91928 RepID=A0A0D2BGI9_9EURO|nr:uncharacterized protein PV08_04950 [Exophiala spinifera]KIW17755.1 hypothetical protein PV08_04950 [Exophiala spinifera]
MSAISPPPRSNFTPSSSKLEDQAPRASIAKKLTLFAAASAALRESRDSTRKRSSSSVLDEDGRLSSASAALSLKYARAQDLPSYPSTGGVKLASAGAAASLAESNKKPFEHWTPGHIPAANSAASKAKDYEMDPLWRPELSRVGSKAAIAAHRDAAPVEIWRAPETEHGNSAAASALQNQSSPPAITERQVSSDGRQKALLAATKSMSSGRRRAESAPVPPQLKQGNSAWALKAAGSVHGRKRSDPPSTPSPQSTDLLGADAARVQNIARNNVSRQMYTSNPPVAIEVEEKNRQDTLRASAVAMARKMYAIQQAQIDEARGIRRSDSHFAAYTARQRAQSDAANQPIQEELPRYENLEDAARRLAHERLAKLHDEHAEYRQYYGQQSPPKQSRLTLRRGRRTSNLQRDDDSDSDEEQSRKIRSQMSIFQSKLAEVDSKKRQADRDALLAIAHKNVTARMNAIDEKVFGETGKASPQQRELWERQARERAQRESDDRLLYAGKVHIGGGKYLDQSEIDAIAKARLQPTLDEITEKAEQQRARDEELRAEQERIKAEQEAEKTRLAEEKAEQKRIQQEQKHEERRVRIEQKAAEKKAREEAKAATDEKKQSGTAKGRLLPTFLSRGGTAGAAAGGATAAAVEGTAHAAEAAAGTTVGPTVEPGEITGDTVHDQVTLDPAEAAHAVASTENEEHAAPKPAGETGFSDDPGSKEEVRGHPYTETQEPTSPGIPSTLTSPSKRDSKVKSWFKRFRSGSKSENETDKQPEDEEADPTATTGRTTDPIKSIEEEEKAESDSVRDVALAGRQSEAETDDMYGGSARPAERVSPLHDEPTSHQVVTSGVERERSISPMSGSSELSEDPYVIAADVASSRYSEHGGSKRDSGMDQAGTFSDSEDEPRGRKGFRERFLKKVIPGRHKDEDKNKSVGESGVVQVESPIAEETIHDRTTYNPADEPTTETEPFRGKVQEPSTTSTDGGNTATTGATTPALTHTQTNGDDDDFEEARDTFDEQRLGPPPKLVEVSKMEAPRLVDVGGPTQKKGGESPASRNSIGGGSRFTEEL